MRVKSNSLLVYHLDTDLSMCAAFGFGVVHWTNSINCVSIDYCYLSVTVTMFKL